MTHRSPKIALLSTLFAILSAVSVGLTPAIASDTLTLAQPGKYGDAGHESHGRTEDSMRGNDWGLGDELGDYSYLWEGPIDGERTRQMMHEIVSMAEWTLRSIEFPDARAQARLLDEVDVARGAIDSIPPETLDVFAEQRGDALRSRYQSSFFRTAELEARRHAHVDGFATPAGTPRAPTKSGGFPTVVEGVPQYPEFDGEEAGFGFSTQALGTGFVQFILGHVEHIENAVNASFCNVGTDAVGRAERNHPATLMLFTTDHSLFRMQAEVWNDLCGGASIDIVILSAGYSCDLCCIPFDLDFAINEMFYDGIMTCEDLIDSAEVEAAYHYSKGAYEGTKHLHDDLEQLETAIQNIGDLGDLDISALEATVARIETKVDDVAEDTNSLVGTAGDIADDTSGLVDTVGDIDARTTSIESKANDIEEDTNSLLDAVGDIDARTTSIETKANDIEEDTNSIEAKVDELEATTTDIEQTTDVTSQVVNLVEDTTTTILDVVSCKAVADLRRGHGCDGIDSDCDGVIDGCSEDTHGPSLRVDPSVSERWFATEAEAAEALFRAATAVDGCQGVEGVTVDVDVPVGTDCDGMATVSATDACGNTTTLQVPVRVDGQAPELSVSVDRPQLFPATGEMANVGFDFDVVDGCGAELAVQVASDEAGAQDAEILRDLTTGELAGIRLRAGRELGPTDFPPGPGNGRVYSITLIATDAAGNTSSATTQVTVPLSEAIAAEDDGQFFDPTGGMRASGPVAFNH